MMSEEKKITPALLKRGNPFVSRYTKKGLTSDDLKKIIDINEKSYDTTYENMKKLTVTPEDLNQDTTAWDAQDKILTQESITNLKAVIEAAKEKKEPHKELMDYFRDEDNESLKKDLEEKKETVKRMQADTVEEIQIKKESLKEVNEQLKALETPKKSETQEGLNPRDSTSPVGDGVEKEEKKQQAQPEKEEKKRPSRGEEVETVDIKPVRWKDVKSKELIAALEKHMPKLEQDIIDSKGNIEKQTEAVHIMIKAIEKAIGRQLTIDEETAIFMDVVEFDEGHETKEELKDNLTHMVNRLEAETHMGRRLLEDLDEKITEIGGKSRLARVESAGRGMGSAPTPAPPSSAPPSSAPAPPASAPRVLPTALTRGPTEIYRRPAQSQEEQARRRTAQGVRTDAMRDAFGELHDKFEEEKKQMNIYKELVNTRDGWQKKYFALKKSGADKKQLQDAMKHWKISMKVTNEHEKNLMRTRASFYSDTLKKVMAELPEANEVQRNEIAQGIHDIVKNRKSGPSGEFINRMVQLARKGLEVDPSIIQETLKGAYTAEQSKDVIRKDQEEREKGFTPHALGEQFRADTFVIDSLPEPEPEEIKRSNWNWQQIHDNRFYEDERTRNSGLKAHNEYEESLRFGTGLNMTREPVDFNMQWSPLVNQNYSKAKTYRHEKRDRRRNRVLRRTSTIGPKLYGLRKCGDSALNLGSKHANASANGLMDKDYTSEAKYFLDTNTMNGFKIRI
jgi:hypothetical protein